MPPPEVSIASKRSAFDVNDDQLVQLMSKWEPYSPNNLQDKLHHMQHESSKGLTKQSHSFSSMAKMPSVKESDAEDDDPVSPSKTGRD